MKQKGAGNLFPLRNREKWERNELFQFAVVAGTGATLDVSMMGHERKLLSSVAARPVLELQ